MTDRYREFNSEDLNYISNSLKEQTNRMTYTGSLLDLGHEIGNSVGSRYVNMTGYEIEDLILGIRHGIMKTNVER